MVVPSVGVVPCDEDGSALPIRSLLKPVDCVDEERLLIQRVGIAWVAVLIPSGLQDASIKLSKP